PAGTPSRGPRGEPGCGPALLRGPRRPRAEAAAEDDDVEVEQVHGRGEREPQRRARPMERREDGVIVRLRAPHELRGDAAHPLARLDAKPRLPRDRLLADERLETTAAPARALRAEGVDGHVAELATESVGAAEEHAVDDDPGP